jgi:hypothetical protein
VHSILCMLPSRHHKPSAKAIIGWIYHLTQWHDRLPIEFELLHLDLFPSSARTNRFAAML